MKEVYLMKGNFNECTAEIGSVTQAMRAQDALGAAAIPAKVIKTQSSSRRGCIYGISYSCAQEKNVRTVLDNVRISVKNPRSGR